MSFAEPVGGNPNERDSQENVVRGSFQRFLESHTTYNEFTQQESRAYVDRVEDMKKNWGTTLNVDYNHLMDYDAELATEITTEYCRYEPFLKQAVMDFVKFVNPQYFHATTAGNLSENAKQFWLCLYDLPTVEKLRDLKTALVGRLTTVSGTVTRTSEVRPELLEGSFQCQECSTSIDGIVQQYKYTEPQICTNPACGNRKKWNLVMEKSTFVDFQKVRVQENSSEIPAGSMPRTMDVSRRRSCCIPRPMPQSRVAHAECLPLQSGPRHPVRCVRMCNRSSSGTRWSRSARPVTSASSPGC